MTEGFTGTGVALVTPFHSDKTINFQALEQLVDHVIEGGVDFIVAMGTTGESATLSEIEKKEVITNILRCNKNRVPVVVGIGGNDTMALVNRIQTTNFDGIDAILSVAPYYNKPTQQGIYEHFSAIARVCPVPIILYNVPGRTASNINAETAVKLASDYKNIIAVKEASGNYEQIKQIINNSPSHFQVLSGDDAATFRIIKEGGSGVISVAANSHPKLFSEMVGKALNNNFGEAKEIHDQFLNYYDALFEEGNPAGLKSALELMGFCSREVRLPLVAASDALVSKMKDILSKLD